MEQFKSWLAVSPIASGLRTAFAIAAVSGLNFILEHYADWGLPLAVQLLVASAIPPTLRAINSNDGVFGAGKADFEVDEPEDVQA